MRSLLVLIALIASPFGAIAQTPESAAHNQPTAAGTAMHLLPDTNNGEVEVIAAGRFDGTNGHIPVIVRNNTDSAIASPVAKVEIKDVNGKLIGVGESSSLFGLSPSHLAPGDIAFGYIDTDGAIAGRHAYIYSVTASSPDDFMASMQIDLTFGEVTWITDRIVGEAVNATDRPVTAVTLTIMCFDQDGMPLFAVQESIRGSIPAQSSTTFQANGLFRGLTDCEHFLIAGTGIAEV